MHPEQNESSYKADAEQLLLAAKTMLLSLEGAKELIPELDTLIKKVEAIRVVDKTKH